ncbi:MAG: RsmD family RNA methyltransferase [Planctomycetota bacterium]|jgi:16S rRNA (guanine(966)-N(2))-methyltransferase RsmD
MVRIIAGEYRSRTLLSREGDESTRPMLSRVKESIFGMLHEWFEGARVLDLFAGVGTIGLEAVSRGASEVLMVESNPRTYKILRENIERLGCGDRARPMLADARGATCLAAAPRPVDLVFLDPPYDLMREDHSRSGVLEQLARCREIMAASSFAVLRSPIGPEEADLEVEGFSGPEPHRYRRDMWVLLYTPAEMPPELREDRVVEPKHPN